MHVSLTPKLEEFVRDKVQAGLYSDASEVIREALRLMQQHDELSRIKLEKLREALRRGEDDLAAGRSVSLSDDEELASFLARL